jgi:tRNA threonylcarbamoyladenosine modification (KEOPS) complex  Pcc1 subunit
MCQDCDKPALITTTSLVTQLSRQCHQDQQRFALPYPVSFAFIGTQNMLAIKKARKLIETNPNDAASQIIAALVLALESETSISVAQLYQLDNKRFELALEILDEWRLDRHYASKLRLIDSSSQVKEMGITLPNTLVNEST